MRRKVKPRRRRSKSRKSTESESVEDEGKLSPSHLNLKKEELEVEEEHPNGVSQREEQAKERTSPGVEEDKREMHRIHERQRHYSLNLAIRKVISALPSMGPSEPETKHYVLKKTSDYITFLEEKIADMCMDMDISHTYHEGEMSFSAPLNMLVDGFQKDIPANAPVGLECLQELLDNLNFKAGHSKFWRQRQKPAATKQGNGGLDGEESDNEDIIVNEGWTGSESLGTTDSPRAGSSMGSMICSESLINVDSSGVGQKTSPFSVFSPGTSSCDDGFNSLNSSKITDQESTQDTTYSNIIGSSSGSNSDMSQGNGESLFELIKSDAKQDMHEDGGATVIRRWAQQPFIQNKLSQFEASVPVATSDHLAPLPIICQTVPVHFPFQGNTSMVQQDCNSMSTPQSQQSAMNMLLPTIPTCQVPATVPMHPFSGGFYTALNSSRSPETGSQQVTRIPPFSSLSTSIPTPIPTAKNILNQSLTKDPYPAPTVGYINCTLTNDLMDTLQDSGQDLSHTSLHLFQPMKHTIEIILDIGPDPMVLSSCYGLRLSSKRSWINGYQLFTKINHKSFRDGWPSLKSKDITRLMGQAWHRIPTRYKRVYSKRACEWNNLQKKQAEQRRMPIMP